MSSPLRIVFMGSDAIALPMLEWLRSSATAHARLVGVFTQPDRPIGRGQKVQPNAIKTWALDCGLPVLQPEKFTDEVRQQLAALAPDLALVMAYGHILRDEVIATPRLGTLNLHASLLPAYRGASPIQTAIASGEPETGVSLMRIVRKLDAGPVADLERVPIAPTDTALEIEAKLAAACVPLVARNLPTLARGELTFIPQDEPRATFCRRLLKDDGVVDFSRQARLVAARINGLFPWPACSFLINGQAIKCARASVLAPGVIPAHPEAVPGQVLGADSESLWIACGEGAVALHRLQRPGGKLLPAGEFLRGFPIPVGTHFPTTTEPALVAPQPFKR